MKKILSLAICVIIMLSSLCFNVSAAVTPVATSDVYVNVAQGKGVTSDFTMGTTASNYIKPFNTTDKLTDGYLSAKDTNGANIYYAMCTDVDGDSILRNTSGTKGKPYFDVDLGRRYAIEKIVIFDHNDGTYTKNRGMFNVYGSDSVDFSDKELLYSMSKTEENNTITLDDGTTFARGGKLEINLDKKPFYRYIRYENTVESAYYMTEFQVYSTVKATEVSRNAVVTGDANYQPAKTASGIVMKADHLTDGDLGNTSGYYLVGGKSTKAQFSIDLESPKHIGLIELYASDYSSVGSAAIQPHTDGRFEVYGVKEDNSEVKVEEFKYNRESYAGVVNPYGAVEANGVRKNYRGPWGFTLDGSTAYKSIVYKKNTNASSSGHATIALNEFRAYEVHPELVDAKADNERQITVRFTDFNMDFSKFTKNNIKVLTSDGTRQISVSDISASANGADAVITLSENLTPGLYKVAVFDIANTYGVKVSGKMVADFAYNVSQEDTYINLIAYQSSSNTLSSANTFGERWVVNNNETITFNVDIPKPGRYNVRGIMGAGTESNGGNSVVSIKTGGAEYSSPCMSPNSYFDNTNVNWGEIPFDKAGTHEVVFRNVSGASVGFVSFNLEYSRDLTEADTLAPITVNILSANKEVDGTYVVASNTDKANRFGSFWCIGNSQYITLNVDIPLAGVYNVSAICGTGTDKTPGTATLDITFGNTKTRKTFSGIKEFRDEINVELGSFAFANPGIYQFKIYSKSGTTVTFRSVTADLVTELEPSNVCYTVSKYVSECSGTVSAETVLPTSTSITLEPGEKISWAVTPAYDGHYDLSFGVNGNGEEYNVYVDGINEFTKYAESVADESSLQKSGEVLLNAGQEYTFTVENSKVNEGTINVTGIQLYRASGFENEVIITDFAIENSEGIRMPYAVVDGQEAHAAITLKKYGETSGEIKLIIAQYENENKLVKAEETTINCLELEDKETKKFTTKLTVEGGGGLFKAFVMKGHTLKPLSKAIACVDDIIFTESDFSKSVEYANAVQIMNESGTEFDEAAYAGYEDADCKIDAIFYDSVVGEQTKVFAYLGIPKKATADNPVPAVILVHGAGGEAWRDWVKDWNKRGYAAISIDLYGTGPEVDSTFVNKNKRHPFAGILPWGDLGEGFKENKEEAGMYQNTINIVNAHTLLESLDVVDSSKTGITGYSYGGVATTVAMGVDDRFEFAVPVYGGGYLDYTKTFIKNGAYQNFNGTSIKWDPVNFAAHAKMPVLYINNDFDSAFSVDTTSWTYSMTPGAYLSIRHGLPHDGGTTRQIEQIADFADAVLSGNSEPYVRITNEKAQDGVLTANVDITSDEIETVKLYYITSEIPYNSSISSPWLESDNTFEIDGGVLTMEVPEDAVYCYAAIKYIDGVYGTTIDEITVSTKLIKVK